MWRATPRPCPVGAGPSVVTRPTLSPPLSQGAVVPGCRLGTANKHCEAGGEFSLQMTER